MEPSTPIEVSLESFFQERNTGVSSWKCPLLSDKHVLELGNGCKDTVAQKGVRETIKEAGMGSFLVYRKRWLEKEQDQKLRARMKQHLQTMKVINERCKWYCPVDGKGSSTLRKVCDFGHLVGFSTNHGCHQSTETSDYCFSRNTRCVGCDLGCQLFTRTT